jgi:HEPN domain-containing protein
MGNRYLDWLRQAESDIQHARNSLEDGDFAWSCFASHQAAEMALKAVFLRCGLDAWGHTLTVLIGNLPKSIVQPSETLINYAKILDKYYIPTRYPNGYETGAPVDYYTNIEAMNAIQQAEAIIAYCSDQISRSKTCEGSG